MMADIKNKNELKRRIELFLDEFTPHEYKINEEFCKETMKMMREFIGHTDNRINVLIAKKEKKDRKIRELQAQIPKWHLCKTRPILPEEKKDYLDIYMGYVYVCEMPKSGQEVFVATKYGCVDKTTYCTDCGCYFEGYEDEDEVVAWMELPKFEDK